MSEEIIFRCYDCGHYFRSTGRDVYVAEESFCHYCGTVFETRSFADAAVASGLSSQEMNSGKCAECEEDIKSRIVAVCPKCRTKNVKIQGTIAR